jgi:hypothetical protein
MKSKKGEKSHVVFWGKKGKTAIRDRQLGIIRNSTVVIRKRLDAHRMDQIFRGNNRWRT